MLVNMFEIVKVKIFQCAFKIKKIISWRFGALATLSSADDSIQLTSVYCYKKGQFKKGYTILLYRFRGLFSVWIKPAEVAIKPWKVALYSAGY